MITDQEYPVRPAFSLLQKVLDEFTTTVPKSAYSNPSSISFPQLQAYLEKYQDPKQADAIMRVQQELDETKIILVRRYPSLQLPHSIGVQHKTIESVLERGTKLDDLVDRSNALSSSSKMFYKKAKQVCTFAFSTWMFLMRLLHRSKTPAA